MAKPVVFVDLDGVLVDFVGGAFEKHNVSMPIDHVRWDFLKDIGFEGREAEFWAPLGRDFWAELRGLPDGMQLLGIIEAIAGVDNVALLSSPCDTAGCCDGKRSWVLNRLGHNYRRKLFLGSHKQLIGHKGAILIDDHDANCESFAARGGWSLLIPRPWNKRSSESLSGVFNVNEVSREFEKLYEEVRRVA